MSNLEPVLGIKVLDNTLAVTLLKQGAPYTYIAKLKLALNISNRTLTRILRISAKTLERKKDKTLDINQSERLIRIARLYDLAVQVFEDQQAAQAWLKTPNPALKGASPLLFATTEPGAREVENLLYALEYGAYS